MKENALMMSDNAKARAIAFYLPQFHPIPENDEWWGKGFTEWTNVAKAKKMFVGHYQPRVPADLGFYDLRVPETRIEQAEMARECGIEGFCYWHYWFAGKRLLERIFDEVLASGQPDFPFCLGWANQTWSGIWHGSPNKILMEQTYPGDDDYTAHFYHLLPAFKDKRYIRVDGKPVFVVYCPHDIPDAKHFTSLWQDLAKKEGLGGIYFIARCLENWPYKENGFAASYSLKSYHTEAGTGRFFVFLDKALNRTVRKIRDSISPLPTIVNYKDVVKKAFIFEPDEPSRIPVVVPNWDNTPRSGARGLVFQGSTPELYKEFLQSALDKVKDKNPQERIIFIRSWNEWAEGNHLEPDLKFGRGYLEATKEVLID